MFIRSSDESLKIKTKNGKKAVSGLTEKIRIKKMQYAIYDSTNNETSKRFNTLDEAKNYLDQNIDYYNGSLVEIVQYDFDKLEVVTLEKIQL